MSVNDRDLDLLRRALRIARGGRFGVEPNPLVGCVVERDGEIVGEGAHCRYGGPHAEVLAVQSAGDAARGATAYVSLEPCSRVLKTGACTDLLREAGIRRVVFASRDPNMPEDGMTGLRGAGVEVEGPVLSEEGAPLLELFTTCLGRARPWVVLKWAMSADGRISPAAGRGGRLTGDASRVFVHDLRSHVDAVAVGVETVLVDDPRLTCRLRTTLHESRPQPRRVIFDSTLRTPPSSRCFDDVDAAPLTIVTAELPDPPRRAALEARGAEVLEVPAGDGGLDLPVALEALHERGVRRLLVEGGARVHGSFFRAGLADQVSAIVAPRVLGGADAPPAVTGSGFSDVDGAPRLADVETRDLGRDLLLQGYVVR